MSRTTYYDEAKPFVANEHSLVRGTGRQIDWDLVPISFGGDAVLVKLSAQAAADATSLSVDALSAAVPAGTLLHFGESKEFARVTAAAAAGATSITVEALPSQIEDNDEAYYWPGREAKRIPAGTVMAKLSSGKVIPRSAVTASETSTSLLESTAIHEPGMADVGHGMIVGGVIFENLLPDWDGGSSGNWTDTYKDELIAAGVGLGWVFESYSDSTS